MTTNERRSEERAGHQIVALARELTEDTIGTPWEASPRGVVLRQLSLALEQFDASRDLHRRLQRELLEAECSVGTLLEAEPDLDEARLHGQLLQLRGEQRRLRLMNRDREDDLVRQMLTLLDRQAYLGTDDED